MLGGVGGTSIRWAGGERGRSMPIHPYAVLVARVVDSRREESGDSPHYQVHVRDETGADYRIAITV